MPPPYGGGSIKSGAYLKQRDYRLYRIPLYRAAGGTCYHCGRILVLGLISNCKQLVVKC